MLPIGTIIEVTNLPDWRKTEKPVRAVIVKNEDTYYVSSGEYIVKCLDKNDKTSLFHDTPCQHYPDLEKGSFYRYIHYNLTCDLKWKVVEMKPLTLGEFLGEE